MFHLMVKLNTKSEKKVYHEDVIEFNGEIVQLLINESLPQQPSELTAQDSFQHTDKSDTIKQSLEHEQETEYKKTTVPKKRRPIAF